MVNQIQDKGGENVATSEKVILKAGEMLTTMRGDRCGGAISAITKDIELEITHYKGDHHIMARTEGSLCQLWADEYAIENFKEKKYD